MAEEESTTKDKVRYIYNSTLGQFGKRNMMYPGPYSNREVYHDNSQNYGNSYDYDQYYNEQTEYNQDDNNFEEYMPENYSQENYEYQNAEEEKFYKEGILDLNSLITVTFRLQTRRI